MRGQSRTGSHFLLVLSALVLVSTPAWAQPAQNVKLSPVEVSLGLTINGLFQDVNTLPDCSILSLPCTHAAPAKFSGLGLNVSVSRNLSERLAITGEVGRFSSGWDSLGSLREHRREAAHATSVLVGPRVSTGFFYPGNGDREPGRFFGQILAGGEASDVAPLRPAFLLGGGADVIIPLGGSRGTGTSPVHALTLRLALDYRLTPGTGRNLSGWRFVSGVVFGPRLS